MSQFPKELLTAGFPEFYSGTVLQEIPVETGLNCTVRHDVFAKLRSTKDEVASVLRGYQFWRAERVGMDLHLQFKEFVQTSKSHLQN